VLNIFRKFMSEKMRGRVRILTLVSKLIKCY
jgi:hypothetical protein